MNRLRLCAALALGIVLVGSPPAEANIWDWLEELNGPGPARSRGNFMVNLICSGTRKDDRSGHSRSLGRVFQLPKEPDADTTCLFFDQRWLHAEADARFHPVDISITEFGTSTWVHRTAEIGAGVGVVRFSSTNPETGQEFKGARMTISFPRVVYRPLLAIPATRIRNNPGWGFFQVYFKESIIVGDLDQGDFASKPGNVFSRRHQRAESMGFIIDATSFARLVHLID